MKKIYYLSYTFNNNSYYYYYKTKKELDSKIKSLNKVLTDFEVLLLKFDKDLLNKKRGKNKYILNNNMTGYNNLTNNYIKEIINKIVLNNYKENKHMENSSQVRDKIKSIFKKVDEIKEKLGIFKKWEETEEISAIDTICSLSDYIYKDLLEIEKEIDKL